MTGLGKFSPVNAFSKKKCAMRRLMRKPHSLMTRCFVECLTKINKYLGDFPESDVSNYMGETELNRYSYTVWITAGVNKPTFMNLIFIFPTRSQSECLNPWILQSKIRRVIRKHFKETDY